MTILWLDIETLPSETPPGLEDIPVPGNYSKPESILKYREENQETEWRKQALNPMQGRIACVSWATGNAPAVCRGIWEKSEREILEELEGVASDMAQQDGNVHWGGFNLKSFDLQWIWIHALRYRLDTLTDFISRDRYPKNILDVRDLWTGGDGTAKGKLKDIAKFLGMSTMGMDGSDVFDLYRAEEFAKIDEYCRADVELTRAIAWRMGKGNPPIIPESKDPFGPTA